MPTKESELESERVEFIALDVLHFDPRNPRFPTRKSLDVSAERQVLEWMLDDATIIELMKSIGESGYFEVEPLLVIAKPKEQGHFLVIEGNRRLAALILLNYPQRAPIKKQAVLEASN